MNNKYIYDSMGSFVRQRLSQLANFDEGRQIFYL